MTYHILCFKKTSTGSTPEITLSSILVAMTMRMEALIDG